MAASFVSEPDKEYNKSEIDTHAVSVAPASDRCRHAGLSFDSFRRSLKTHLFGN